MTRNSAQLQYILLIQGVPRYWIQCNPYKGIFVGLQLHSTNHDISLSINHINLIIITILFFRKISQEVCQAK